MFCKKCGNAVKEGAGFCPKCGSKIEGLPGNGAGGFAGGALPGMPPAGGQPFSMPGMAQPEQKKKAGMDSARKKKLLTLGAGVLGALVLIAVIVLVVRGIGGFGKGTIVGEWISTEDIDLEGCIEDLLVEEGFSRDTARLVMELTGMDELGEVNLTFTNSEKIYIGIDDVSVGLGTFTYEDLGNGRIMLKYELDASVLGNSIPISLSYKADYKVTKKKLILDLFGYEAEFTRKP